MFQSVAGWILSEDSYAGLLSASVKEYCEYSQGFLLPRCMGLTSAIISLTIPSVSTQSLSSHVLKTGYILG